MSTRSNIAILTEEGKVKSIYCHFDGYPSGVGKKLFNHYQQESKVQELIELGDCSCIGERVKPDEGEHHSYSHKVKDITVAYMRDRGETDCEAQEIESLDAYQPDNDYAYIWMKGKWHVCNPYRKTGWKELTNEIIESDTV